MRIVFLNLVLFAGVVAIDETLPLLDRMIETGIVIRNDQNCIVPKPLLNSGQDAVTRKKVLERLAGGRGWQKFSRKSFAAPVAIDVKYIKDARGARIGHQIHVAFVVHAPLARLKDEQLMEQLFGKLDEPDEAENIEGVEVAHLTEEEVKSFGVDSVDQNETYGEIQMRILKRVKVRGIVRTQKLVADDAIVIAWEIDPRFTSDVSGRNTWSPIIRDNSGRKREGEQRPYQGAGGYARVSELSQPKESCLVELRMVIHEPEDWFHGSHFLRSKIPILMQENARNFRRKLMRKP